VLEDVLSVPEVDTYQWHLPAQDIPSPYASKFKFGSIRNPWSWYYSWYQLLKAYPNDFYARLLLTKPLSFVEFVRKLLSDETARALSDTKTFPMGDPKRRAPSNKGRWIKPFEYMKNLDVGFFSYHYIYLFFNGYDKAFYHEDPKYVFANHDKLMLVDTLVKTEGCGNNLVEALRKSGVPLRGKQVKLITSHRRANTSKVRTGDWRNHYDTETVELVRYKDRIIIDNQGYTFD
jgi:hypothetical protein